MKKIKINKTNRINYYYNIVTFNKCPRGHIILLCFNNNFPANNVHIRRPQQVH